MVEVMIVVVGIFVGLQVTEWNKHQTERVEEGQYLERLYADLIASDEDQQSQLQRLEFLLPKYSVTLDSLNSRILAPEMRLDFKKGIVLIGVTVRPLTHFGTINELHSTGKLLVIKDLQVRNYMNSLKQSYKIAKGIQLNHINVIANLSPTLSRHVVYQEAITLRGKNIYQMDFSVPAFIDFDAMKDDKDYISAVNRHYILQAYLFGILKKHNTNTHAFRTYLEKVLEREGQ